MPSTPRPRLARFADLAALSEAVAEETIALCRSRQAEGAVPCLVLTGGSGGAAVLAALAAHPELRTVDWRRMRLLWGDERWVPAGHPERNDRLADETLLAAVAHDPALVHRVPASDSGLDLDGAAAAYAELVDGLERIDLVLSGVGPDGHVASIFPGRDDLLSATASAIPVRDSPKPPPERVSLTLPALNRAERSWLLAAGAAKAEAVAGIVAPGPETLPAARLAGSAETTLWADEAALGAQ